MFLLLLPDRIELLLIHCPLWVKPQFLAGADRLLLRVTPRQEFA